MRDNIYIDIAISCFMLGGFILLITGLTLIGKLYTANKDHKRLEDDKRIHTHTDIFLATPAVIVLAALVWHAGEITKMLVQTPDSQNSITHVNKINLVPLSKKYSAMNGIKITNKDFYAEDLRYSADKFGKIRGIDVYQFVIPDASSSKRFDTVEVSPKVVKIKRDLANNQTAYFGQTTCTWKKSLMRHYAPSCPTSQRTLHLPKDALKINTILTYHPDNTNDQTEDPDAYNIQNSDEQAQNVNQN